MVSIDDEIDTPGVWKRSKLNPIEEFVVDC
jgi:hypothetical protein